MSKLNRHSFAHKMVAHLQVEIAQEVFEEWAKNDAWYAAHKDQRGQIVSEIARTLRDDARRILGEMLARNDVSEFEKKAIFDALVKDAAIPNEDRWESVTLN